MKNKTESYARRGEVCTCTKGHPIFTFKRTVRKGDVPADADTCNWKQKKLKVGDPIPYCEVCGSKFAYNNPAVGFFVYIDGKWRMGRHGIAE